MQTCNTGKWQIAAAILVCQVMVYGSDIKLAVPRVFIAEGEAMPRVRQMIRHQSGEYLFFTGPLDALRQEADKTLRAGPFSVTFKTRLPPSKDKHDYQSLGIYW